MKKILPVILLSLIIASCSSMPAEIDDRYLSDKTETESKIISSIEQKIIDKYKEKQAVEKKLKEQSVLPSGTGEEIKLLREENDLLKEQVYFYEKNKDAVNLELKKAQLAENEKKLELKTALLAYQQSEKRLFEAERDLKNAELAQYIAELNVKKSQVAAEYRNKNEPPKPEEKENFFSKLFNSNDPSDRYGYKKYDEYLEKKKQETLYAESGYREADKQYQEAKAALDKIK